MTAEAGAGIYLTERRALVEALHHLLQLHALPDADAAKDIQSAVDSFVESLLSETSGGRSIMIARLVELIGVSIITRHCLNLTSSVLVDLLALIFYPAAAEDTWKDSLNCTIVYLKTLYLHRMTVWSHSLAPG